MRKYWKHFALVAIAATSLLSCGSAGDEHISAPSSAKVAGAEQAAPEASHVGSNIDAETFKKEIFDYSVSKEWKFKHNKACVIDFYADWCRPCKMLAPELASVVATTNGNVDLFKVNVDDEKELAGFFNIQSIPTMLFCPADGSKPFVLQGLVSREELNNAIGRVMASSAKQ